MRLIITTKNQGKARELKSLLEENSSILTLKEIDFNVKIVEDKDTFMGNAEKKALTVYELLKESYRDYFFLGEDSGLEVEALGGRPGVYSARYAGENATDDENIKKLLLEMEGIPFEKRNANYNCSMMLISPEGKIIKSSGKCYGKIAFEPKGTNGFGYDPIFLTEESGYKITMAELSETEKNKISHRKKALEGILNELKYY
ncbi:MAG: RdgB/HAM1 family non-canonical purine NTP pyrophosphatase [Brevinematia bacterium]